MHIKCYRADSMDVILNVNQILFLYFDFLKWSFKDKHFQHGMETTTSTSTYIITMFLVGTFNRQGQITQVLSTPRTEGFGGFRKRQDNRLSCYQDMYQISFPYTTRTLLSIICKLCTLKAFVKIKAKIWSCMFQQPVIRAKAKSSLCSATLLKVILCQTLVVLEL